MNNPKTASISKILRILRSITTPTGQSLDLDHAAVLLHVAENPGINQVLMTRALGSSQPTMSRILLRLGDLETPAEKGLGYVRVLSNPLNRSSHIVTLSQSGRRLVKRLQSAIQ